MTEGYEIFAYWGPRPETAAECAPKVLRMLSTLAEISPHLARWLGQRPRTKKIINASSLDLADMTDLIAHGRNLSEDDYQPILSLGYRFTFVNRERRDPLAVALYAKMGGYTTANLHANIIWLETEPFDPRNADLISFPIFKSALLAFAGIWNASYCYAGPIGLAAMLPHDERRMAPRFCGGWIVYLSPRFAPMVVPPRAVVSERTSDGGLLMIATEERFSAENPAHMSAARDIEAALAPVNALPWPPDAEPSAMGP